MWNIPIPVMASACVWAGVFKRILLTWFFVPGRTKAKACPDIKSGQAFSF